MLQIMMLVIVYFRCLVCMKMERQAEAKDGGGRNLGTSKI